MNIEEKASDFPKEGFARLVRSFENTDDIVRLTRAFGLATKGHRGEGFGRSEPYLNHLVRVATILVDELQLHDVDLACAALLLDLELSREELLECGERAYSIALAATAPKDRALEEYYSRLARAPKEARFVRLADKLDSARSMKGQSLRAAKYREEMEKHVVPLANATDDRLAFKLSVALYELK